MEQANVVELYDNIRVPLLSFETTALVLFVSLPLAALIGFVVGSRISKARHAKNLAVDQSLGDTTLPALLALLGLLLAFTFGNALGAAKSQETALINEATALGTAFARADYLPESDRSELQETLLDYAKTRIVPVDGRLLTKDALAAFLDKTMQSQSWLWPTTVDATRDLQSEPVKVSIFSSMNDVLDAHHYRMQSVAAAVGSYTELMLFIAAIAALFLLGNRSGIKGRSLSWRTFFLSGFLFVVMVSIVDTLRGSEGFILTDQTALEVTIFEMEQALKRSS